MSKNKEKGLIAKKIGMTRVADTAGNFVPVTLLQIPDQKVTKLLTDERNGYVGYQVGYQIKAKKNLTKADLGRLKKVEIETAFSQFTEFRIPETHLKVGDNVTASDLDIEVGIKLDATGVTKGRGFQGATKRWNSAIGRMTHGSHFHRRPGSLGQNTTPGRCFKNRKMPGRYGAENVTIKNLEVVRVDLEKKLVALRGAVPGHKNGFVELRSTSGSTAKK